MLNIVDISKNRYTTKHYDKNRHISQEQLNQLLEVLRNSPSSVNSQPWHFVVVNNRTSKNTILPAIAEFNHSRITDSSYTIVFCVKTEMNDQFLQHLLAKEEQDGRLPNDEIKQAQDKGSRYFVSLNSQTKESFFDWEHRQLYIALGQFLFAAMAIGIDSTAIEGFDTQKIDELLGLKQKGLKSVVLASIGYRADNDSNANRPKSRLEKEELFSFI